MFKVIKKKFFLAGLVFIGFFYLATHLLKLTALPVFADEAIYIRWAQLIIDDWQRYLFFPLNDGKTPLLMWLFVPFQYIFKDQLFAGRFVSILIGLVQVYVIGLITKVLGGKKKTQLLAMIFTSILPFWYFYHRMALTDSLLALFLSLTFLFTVKTVLTEKKKKYYQYILLSGLFYGLALWSKLPAILFLPIFPLSIFLHKKVSLKSVVFLLTKVGFSALIGLLIFAALKLNPAFSQIFSRGGDFLYPADKWLTFQTLHNLWYNCKLFALNLVTYLTWPVILFSLVSLFISKHKKQQVILLLAAVIFLSPMALLGKVIYPRYLLPAAIFITVSSALAVESIISLIKKQSILKQVIYNLIFIFIFVQSFAHSSLFMYQSWFDSDHLGLSAADKIQYLYEWSSGHGIKETVTLIKSSALEKNTLVLTEGYFGTLPDALLMYFHRRNVNNIFIQGIGQPVREIPAEVFIKSNQYDQVFLVVNSYRLNISFKPENLIAEFCRPDNAPCLQVWNITNYLDDNMEK